MNFFELVIVQPIFNLLLGLYSIIPGGDFGVAVIIFTIIVRLALWPLVKKQLNQTKAMQKLQPELARIKKESGGNKQVESLKMMELYKEYDIHPFQSILVLLIQLPIFIALYQVIRMFVMQRDKIEQFTYGVMRNLGPVKALIAHPENLNQKLFGFLDLTKQAVTASPFQIDIALLILVLAAVWLQYIMSKQTMPQSKSAKTMKELMKDAADGKTVDQSEMNAIMSQRMIKFTPFMMLLIMINLPGALALYYAVSNLAAVAQQSYILKKDSEEMIEIADEAPLLVGQHKKATAKARAKQAQEATVVRITAKDNTPFRKNHKEDKT
jgi:YidC/Oxa1 family membrane protein insertase